MACKLMIIQNFLHKLIAEINFRVCNLQSRKPRNLNINLEKHIQWMRNEWNKTEWLRSSYNSVN